MNVVFLNTLYQPTQEKLRALRVMQEQIYYTKVEYLFALRGLHPSIIKARKEEMHWMWRNKWEVIVSQEPEEDL